MIRKNKTFNFIDKQINPKYNWEDEFNSMFDWADQIKEQEIERWKIDYDFTPDDIKQFISDLLKEEQNKWHKAGWEDCSKEWLDVIEDGTSIDDILFKAQKRGLITN